MNNFVDRIVAWSNKNYLAANIAMLLASFALIAVGYYGAAAISMLF